LFERVDYRVIFPAAAVLGMAASLRQRCLPVPAAAEAGERIVGGLRQAWAAVRDDHLFRRLLMASFLFGAGCWIQTPAHPPLDVVWLMVVIDIAGPTRAAQYVAIGATLAGVRGVLGPLLGGLLIGAFGVRAVYVVALALMTGAAWLVVREPARRAVVYSRS